MPQEFHAIIMKLSTASQFPSYLNYSDGNVPKVYMVHVLNRGNKKGHLC